jgi:hypothetical protein
VSFRIAYKDLFEIQLLHHYFLDKGEENYDGLDEDEKDSIQEKYDVREFFEITPTIECQKLLNDHQCVYKNTSTGILIGIKAIPDEVQPNLFIPFNPPGPEVTFRFLIRNRDTYLLNYTALPFNGNIGTIYVFKNHAFNSNAKFPSLSSIPPLYHGSTTYFPGDMLSDDPSNQTKLFTALVKTTNNPSVSSDWLTEAGNAKTPLHFANSNDRQNMVNGFLNYQMKIPGTIPEITIKNSSGQTINPEFDIIPEDQYIIQANLRNFPQGFYTLHVESSNTVYQDDQTFYLLHETEKPFGIIEIKVKSNQDRYDLLDQGHLVSPVYELRFRNRRTHWRYTGKFFNTPFVVSNPLPLTIHGNIEIIKPPEPDDTKTIILPNPSDPVIKPEALNMPGETKYYSDIHIN